LWIGYDSCGLKIRAKVYFIPKVKRNPALQLKNAGVAKLGQSSKPWDPLKGYRRRAQNPVVQAFLGSKTVPNHLE